MQGEADPSDQFCGMAGILVESLVGYHLDQSPIEEILAVPFIEQQSGEVGILPLHIAPVLRLGA
ncbi:hypothetical protein D3C71_2106520 [compost metagenome]